MTDIRTIIAELRELEAKATPGEWHHHDGYNRVEIPDIESSGAVMYVVTVEDGLPHNQDIIDAKIACASRNALPRILDYIESLENALDNAYGKVVEVRR